MKRLLAFALLLAPITAKAADAPCYQWGPDNGCIAQFVPLVPTGNPLAPFAPLGSLSSTTQTVNGTIADSNSAPYTDWPTITPASGTYTVPTGTRRVVLVATVAGNVTITSGTGNAATLPIAVGETDLGGIPATFTTTATLTAYGFK